MIGNLTSIMLTVTVPIFDLVCHLEKLNLEKVPKKTWKKSGYFY